MRGNDLLDLVARADRVGMSSEEWVSVCASADLQPLDAEEWREAMLSSSGEAD